MTGNSVRYRVSRDRETPTESEREREREAAESDTVANCYCSRGVQCCKNNEEVVMLKMVTPDFCRINMKNILELFIVGGSI